MSVTARPVTQAVGAEISGVDLRSFSDQDFAAIVLDHRADDRNGFRHGPSGVCRLPGRKRGTAHA